ncbi:MAG: hypothetical protein M1829_002107 [Trizodia sp. TS-e1964]|nr:MAG: hypothetical protein M1829_002107 [Trizodia sp. TS-e1964]
MPQTGSVDEFPPLGRTINTNGEIGQDRRGALSAFGGHVNRNGFASTLGQNQPGLVDGMISASLDRRTLRLGGGNGSYSRSDGSAMLGPRSQLEIVPPGRVGGADDKNAQDMVRSIQTGIPHPSVLSTIPISPQSSQASRWSGQQVSFLNHPSLRSHARPQQQQHPPQLQSQQQSFLTDPHDSSQAVSIPADSTNLGVMGELDKWGLTGLLTIIRNENADQGALATGQDLTALGLDLNSSDPLYPTFASPFGVSDSRIIQPDFALPTSYTVLNVPPVHSKVQNFADETLFYIFYTMTRDIMQEVAAAELTSRNWRYHKELKQWLTKDPNYDPVRLTTHEERGFYIFFNPASWQRERREFQLQYESLDSRTINPVQSLPLPQH